MRVLPNNSYIPTFEQVVECERQIMQHFNWDLMMIIPTHFVRCFLANGVIFDNEACTTLAKKV